MHFKSQKEINLSSIAWTKAQSIANILLALFTMVYVGLTYNMLSEMKQQNELSQRNLQETMRPHLLIVLDSVQLHIRPFGGHPANTLTAQVRVENNGNTPAKIFATTVDVFALNKNQLNVRDSLLKGDDANNQFSEDSSNISTYVPPHSSLKYVRVIHNISSRIRTDGTFFIHYLIMYGDVFQSYYDIYSITRYELDLSKHGLSSYPPAYNFHDYTQDEIKKFSHKFDSALGPAK